MDCFQDCCLYCDRDSPDGAYCSQQCKLADHERASNSPVHNYNSPASSGLSHWTSSQAVLDQDRSRSAYFSSSNTTYGILDRATTTSPTTNHERQLSPSSSRTSLSSTISSSPGSSASAAMASQAKQDLQGYFSSFDQARAAKRRSSTR